MRCLRRGVQLAMVVAGTAGAQTIPQLAVEVSVGQGGHTYRTAKDSFTTPNAEINRLAAALRVGPERAFTPVIMLESSIGNGRNGTDAVGGSCFVARCPRAFPGPSGLAVGLEGRGSWTRLTFGAGGGLGALPHFTRYVSANAAVRVFSTWSVLVDMRHLWTTSDNGEAIIFHPLSFGIRYGHNTEE